LKAGGEKNGIQQERALIQYKRNNSVVIRSYLW